MLHAVLTSCAHIHTHLASCSILLLYAVMRTSPHHDVGVILACDYAVGAVMGWGVFLFDITHSDGHHPHCSAIALAIPGKVLLLALALSDGERLIVSMCHGLSVPLPFL